jgi:hypothetical protein
VAETVIPIIERIGLSAGLAVGAALLAMLVRRNEVLALVAGLTVAIAARAWGL